MTPTRLACVFASALLTVTALSPAAAGTPAVDESPPRIFRFTTDGFWLNLHHFLYVLGRVEARMPDVERRAVAQAPGDEKRGMEELSLEEQALWREAVAIYAEGPSQLDMVFDEKLFEATHRLKGAESLEELEIDSRWKDALEKAEPLYRRAWWPEHRAANAAWVEATEPLLDEHGEAVLDFLLRAYGQTWPEEGYPVQLSGYANWAGAYSTEGHLLVISSLDDAMRATLAGLEIVFHEAAHQFDSAVFDELVAAARAEGIRFGRGLGHALLFYTVGEAVRNAASEHVPYAHAYGVWSRGMGQFLPALEAGWQPYLASEALGDGTARRAALRALMRALGETRQPTPPPSTDP
ncbi:MAG TPA: hypothetical protein VNB06_03025 [Thermoanaerobaculia bacterium]|nr:hypothetical protein [Thermoanaerobaculia bacterium]